MTSPLPHEQSPLPPPGWPPERAVAVDAAEPRALRPSRARRYTLIGLSAGLIGGAAVGLAGTLPGLTQAAGPSPQLVAAPDDPSDDSSDDTSDEGSETITVLVDDEHEPGEWIRAALQPLVDDGTLSADELERVVSELLEARPAFPRMGHHGPGEFGRGGHPHVMLDREELAAVLGIDLDELATELRAGKSLATIAGEHGVDVQVVIDMLVADAEARLDDAVANGRLTDDEAADRAATIRERVTELVNREFALPPMPPELPLLPDAPVAPDAGDDTGDDTSNPTATTVSA
jgi:polyhydroxyalkanoate synthesis regulator phasin